MPIAAPPFGTIRDFKAPQPLGRENRPVCCRADKLRRLAVDNELADFRADAVGTDDDIGLGRGAVAEDQAHGVACLVDACELMAEDDRAGCDDALKNAMQIAAMDMHIGSAEAMLCFRIERDLIQRLATVPGAADIAPRLDAGLDETLLDAKTAQNFRDVGAQDDSSTDPRKGGCLLENLDRESGALQEAGGAQAAEAGADDRNPRCPIHDQ